MKRKDTRAGDRHTGPRPRTLRGIDDELWAAAIAKARRDGVPVSVVIAHLLAGWVQE